MRTFILSFMTMLMLFPLHGKGNDTADYTVSYADGIIRVTWPEGTVVEPTDFLGLLHPTLVGYDGFVSAGVWGMRNEIVTYATLSPGNYTLMFPAGDFMVNSVPNATFSEEFTVEGDDGFGSNPTPERGVITIQYPTENQPIACQENGGKMCTFTTNKEYAQVTIEIINDNPVRQNLYAFPVRMVDNAGEHSDNLHVGENTVSASTPDGGNFYFFRGDTYRMVVKGFVNMWDVIADNYDAMAEVRFVGDGMDPERVSATRLLRVTPEGSAESPGKIALRNGIITLEFDGPVAEVHAITPQGMNGEIRHAATALDGSGDQIWKIQLGDLRGLASEQGETSYVEVDVTAMDADSAIVAFSDDRADRGLVLMYQLVDDPGTDTDHIVLHGYGSPGASTAHGVRTYTLSGQQGKNARGILIINGKKCIAR